MRVEGNTLTTREPFETKEEAASAYKSKVSDLEKIPEKERPALTFSVSGLTVETRKTFGSPEAALAAAQEPGKKARALKEKAEEEKKKAEKEKAPSGSDATGPVKHPKTKPPKAAGSKPTEGAE